MPSPNESHRAFIANVAEAYRLAANGENDQARQVMLSNSVPISAELFQQPAAIKAAVSHQLLGMLLSAGARDVTGSIGGYRFVDDLTPIMLKMHPRLGKLIRGCTKLALAHVFIGEQHTKAALMECDAAMKDFASVSPEYAAITQLTRMAWELPLLPPEFIGGAQLKQAVAAMTTLDNSVTSSATAGFLPSVVTGHLLTSVLYANVDYTGESNKHAEGAVINALRAGLSPDLAIDLRDNLDKRTLEVLTRIKPFCPPLI